MAQLQNLIFDIETCPSYDRSDLWLAGRERPKPAPDGVQLIDGKRGIVWVDEAAWLESEMKAMSLQPEACMLVGLNIIMGDGEPKSGWVGEPNQQTGLPWTESDLLALFWTLAAQCPRLIGFNCLRFDIPVIKVRSALLGVQPTVDLTDLKPWGMTVVDVMRRRFADASREQYMSLKALRRVLQLPVPEKYAEVAENTGADVESLYLQFLAGGDDAAEALRVLKLYGELDVCTTRALAQLWSGYFYGRIE